MAIATRTLRDTVVETGGGASGGKVTILVNMDDNTTANSNISVSYTHLTLPTTPYV